MRSSWWLVVGSWLAAGAAVVGVYELGYVRGEIAALRGRDVLVASEQGGSNSSDATGTSRPQWEVTR